MNKNFQNDATYGESLDALAFSESAKARMKHNLLSTSIPNRHHIHRPVSAAVVAAVLSLAFAFTAAAAISVVPTLREFYQNSIGYQQSSVELNQSVEKSGWTMTLTDCIMDEYNIYIGINLTAPDGTVLDAVRGYDFDDWDISFAGEEDIGGASHYERVDDGNPEDNSLSYILWATYLMRDVDWQSLDGKELGISFSGLYHNGEWDEATKTIERIYDCQETWSFTSKISLPEKMITIEPNTPVVTLGVEASITKIEVTPIGAYIYIEGDALKGHHSWVPKDAPDGSYGCVDYQDVVLNLLDGTKIVLDKGMSGSGCSGGTDTSEPGRLFLARRGDTLVDMDTLDFITVCGVDIALR